MSRVNDEQLLAYAADELSEPEAERIRAYVAEHEDAARRVALYRLAARRTAGDDTEPAPAAAVARAKSLFVPRPEAAPGPAERLGQIVASLIYDSRVQPAAVRFSGTGRRVQLTFEAGEVEIDLRAECDESADQWRVMGQVDAEPAPGVIEVSVARVGASTPVAELQSDDRALFSFEVPTGLYDLRLTAGDRVVLLAGVEIG